MANSTHALQRGLNSGNGLPRANWPSWPPFSADVLQSEWLLTPANSADRRDGGQDGFGRLARGRARGLIAVGRDDQDMGGLEEVSGSEAREVLLVELLTGSSSGSGVTTPFDRAHRGLFRRLGASFGITQRFGFDAEAPGSCSSNSRTTSARAAACQASDRLFRRMVLDLAAMTRRAITAPLTLIPSAWVAHSKPSNPWPTPRVEVGAGATIAAANHLIAAAPGYQTGAAPDMHQPGKREQQEDRHAQQQMRLEDRMHIQNISGDAAATSGSLAPTP